MTGMSYVLATYTSWERFWFIQGFVLWTPAYVTIVFIALRRHVLEIPMVAATSNIAWEFLWGFVFHQDMSPRVQHVYRGAFVLDLFILGAVFLLGAKQTTAPLLKRHHIVLVVALLAGWGALFWSLQRSGYDLPLGTNSAYVDTLVMSTLYLWFFLTGIDVKNLSFVVACSKGLGTAMVTVFVFLRYPDNEFAATIAVICGLLDATYIVVLGRAKLARRRSIASPPVSTA